MNASYYRLQDRTTQNYTAENGSADRIARHVVALANGAHGKLLDLGGGAGVNGACLAKAGFTVTMLDLIGEFCAHARTEYGKSIRVIQGDFFEVDLPEKFRVVMAVGEVLGGLSSPDQKRVFQRINGWLDAGGVGVVQVVSPTFWERTSEFLIEQSGSRTHYSYSRRCCELMLSCMADDGDMQTEKLTAHSPRDLDVLLIGSGLRADKIVPAGRLDRDAGGWVDGSSLADSMSYFARIVQQ